MATQLKPDETPADPPPNDNDGEGESQPRDVEAEAREHGWSPKDDFKGDPSRWVDAETFMKRADEVMPLLKTQNQRLKRDLDEMKKHLKRASDHFSKAEERAFERARAEIEAKLETAVESGDVEAAKGLIKDMDKLKDDVGEAPAGKHTKEEAVEAFDAFRDANPWYDRANLASASELDVNARLYADRMTEKHIDKTKDMQPAEFFSYIGGLVEERYPLLKAKGQARPKPQSDVAGATPGRASRGGRAWSDLPAEVRTRFDKWIDNGIAPGKTKEESRAYYVKTFDWDGYAKAG
jgi:hypothetical protein